MGLFLVAAAALFVSSVGARAIPAEPAQADRPTVRYVSPAAASIQKWVATAKVSQESIDDAKELLELDSRIESFYLGDGKVQPPTPYNPFVNASKTGVAQFVTAAGSEAASASDIALQRNWAQITSVAYCNTSVISSWSCPGCKTNVYGQPSSIVAADQEDSRFYGGYIASTNTIFMAFRGSHGLSNFLSDVTFATTNYWIAGKAPSDAKFHTGFQDLYSKVSPAVRAFVTSLASTYPSATVVFTGHSLGAALAMHASLDLAQTNYVPRLTTAYIKIFTFGQPRIGNQAASAWITAQSWAAVYRVVNYDDLVPRLPYQWMGYRHHRRQWWILKDGFSVVTCNDVNAYDNEDTDCLGSVAGVSVASHLLYFGVPMRSNC